MHASPLGALGRGENGGGNLAVRRLCEGLAESGIPTDVFVRRDDPRVPGRGDDRADEPPGPAARGAARARCPRATSSRTSTPSAAPSIAHAASERRRYVVVHGHYWLGGLVAQQLRDAWQVPWVQSFHTLARAKARVGPAARRAPCRRRGERWPPPPTGW